MRWTTLTCALAVCALLAGNLRNTPDASAAPSVGARSGTSGFDHRTPAVSAPADTTLGSDDEWCTRFVPPGAFGTIDRPYDSTVRALGSFRDDLVVAGDFAFLDGVPVPGVGLWDGKRWMPMGAGVPFRGGVRCLTEYRDRLFAGGSSSGTGADTLGGVVQWDGTTWRALGSGSRGFAIQAMLVFGGDLVAAGAFPMPGSQFPAPVARWDSSVWHPMAADSLVNVGALANFRGALYAAGSRTGSRPFLAKWNGNSWEPIDGAPHGVITAVAVYRDRLFVACPRVVGKNLWGGVLATWDGSAWSTVPDRLLGSHDGTWLQLTTYQDQLAVTGDFNGTSEVRSCGILAWDGTRWSNLQAMPALAGREVRILATTTHAGRLIVGGDFSDEMGTNDVLVNLLAWDGTRWSTVAPHSIVPCRAPSAFLATDPGLVVAGLFMRENARELIGGVGIWNGSTWKLLASRVYAGGVNDLVDFHGRLVAAGSFEEIDGLPAHGIAQWNGKAWTALGTGTDIPGNRGPSRGEIKAVEVYRGRLVAGGYFEWINHQRLPWIAQWDGRRWSPLGGGVSGPVLDLALYEGDLIVGGSFDSAGVLPARGIARWNGRDWKSMQSNLGFNWDDSAVEHIQVWNDRLVVAGGFADVAGRRGPGLALWNGSEWRPFPVLPVRLPDRIKCMGVYGQLLVVGGDFWRASDLWMWDGGRWLIPGSGAWAGGRETSSFPGVTALATWKRELYVGGSLTMVGGRPSLQIARWRRAHAR